MPDTAAISLAAVGKAYKLYPNRISLAMDALGLNRLLPWKRPSFPEHWALRGIDLGISRGERVGIIGRNGAGKTTLLRLVSGIAAPTTGSVSVAGRVQALLDTGLGFHPDFTGLENIKASLVYNGLRRDEYAVALQEVIDFVELGEYLHQPLKIYSLGMQARLSFAAATAIRPDILIIDEVMGAGDAYFQSKCADRMKQLTAGGATLLLASHSMQQIIQFCDRAVWIEQGKIVGHGDCLEVVKAYEAHVRRLDDQRLRSENARRLNNVRPQAFGAASSAPEASPPHELVGGGPEGRRLSRWKGLPGPKIYDVKLLDDAGHEGTVFETGSRLEFKIFFNAENAGTYNCRFVILLFAMDGKPITLHCSDYLDLILFSGEQREISLLYDPVMLGNGDYVFSVAIYQSLELDDPSTAEIYDLLDRSYHFKVFSKHPHDQSVFHHPARWSV